MYYFLIAIRTQQVKMYRLNGAAVLVLIFLIIHISDAGEEKFILHIVSVAFFVCL